MFALTDEELKNKDAFHTTKEIEQQPEIWKETIAIYKKNQESLTDFLEKISSKHKEVKVIFTGAGTSAYVGNTVLPYLKENNQLQGWNFESIPTTSLVANPYHHLNKETPTLLVSFARSGNSPESVASVDLATQLVDDLYQLTITCSPEGKLAKNSQGDPTNFLLLMPEKANDKGFAMTGAFTSMTLATLLVFDSKNLEAKEQIVDTVRKMAESIVSREDEVQKIVDTGFKRIVFLGSGSLEGLAQEAQLKMLELTAGQIVTAYDSPLGFRHGPKSIVNEETALFVFRSTNDYTRSYGEGLLNEVYEDDQAKAIWSIDWKEDPKFKGNTFSLGGDRSIPDAYLGIAYIIFAQTIALLTSVTIGNKPDNPSPTGTVNRVVKGVVIHPYTK
ncbi:SIS domain-containing protein [Lacticigenium naphthae]|uniref:SIS domain-containing protein n=1 Tax=Lacticigenium naphthae TaxID=515351 RepID=UPI000409034D|nr:SIS domain-containing protein [Lacticigenium naphthae]